MMKKATGDSEVIKSLSGGILNALMISGEISVTTTDADSYLVNISAQESGLLIGFHGETLAAFQLILGLSVYKQLNKWVRVLVEVGDYRAKREEQLIAMAQGFAARAMATNSAVILPHLTAADRRIIHLALQDNPEVVSLSEGEGEQRHLIVRPR